jgi:uncharacterized membrane protein YhfC
MSHTWLYAVLGALLAGLFEETGRFIAFKFLLKKRTDRKTAISYGIGHGGFEAIFGGAAPCSQADHFKMGKRNLGSGCGDKMKSLPEQR